MTNLNPIQKSKEQYSNIINQIKAESNVGIDAQYTHAIIIDYLSQLAERMERMEKRIDDLHKISH